MNGKVLLGGGDIGDGDGGSFIAERYDPATGAFSRTGNMTVGREQHTETLLPDGSVLFAGGHLVFDLAVSAEIYDPIQGAFTRTANMPTAHELHTATLLNDGRVLIAGATRGHPAPYSTLRPC
jgi:S-adenosylhomocysteine hydrolase